MAGPNDFFSKLTRLFRSGPVIKRKVQGADTLVAVPDPGRYSSAVNIFQRSVGTSYNSVTVNAYNTSERLMRYEDFNQMEACIAGDTKIAVPGGFKTIKELSEEFGDRKPFIVYAYDHRKGELVAAWAHNARLTNVLAAYRVKFSDGTELVADATHRLMRRDGTYARLCEAKIGESMMPFIREERELNGHIQRCLHTFRYNNNQRSNDLIYKAEALVAAGAYVNAILFNTREWMPADGNWLNCKLDNVLIVQSKSRSQKRLIDYKSSRRRYLKKNDRWFKVSFDTLVRYCDHYGYDYDKVCYGLDIKPCELQTLLKQYGFDKFERFAQVYCLRKDRQKTSIQTFFDEFSLNRKKEFCERYSLEERNLQSICYRNKIFVDFPNLKPTDSIFLDKKIVGIEYVGEMELYDLTVHGYKNFATDSIIVHNTAEINAALDIMADETCAQDEKGRTLHVFSNNSKIKKILEDLYYNTLNVEFNLRPWARNLVKYGDAFMLADVSQDYGVQALIPIPVNEIEREEGFDKLDPTAVRFRWVAFGNRALENWEVLHFRLLGNDLFLPYGSSMLDGARRIWRQLILIEDAMLVYRIDRAPERRVFYIDVGAASDEQIPLLIEQAKMALKSSSVSDKSTGRIDLRFNPLSVTEDYFIPIRGDSTGTKIDSLAGGQNTAAVEDVEYIQKKLIAALKVPKSFLGFDQAIAAKSSLAAQDIRFSRTINMIQRTLISELNKVGIIHLYANGFSGEDLTDFSLRLSNPSSIAQQQKLELIRTKLEIAGTVPENLLPKRWILTQILELTPQEIEMNERWMRMEQEQGEQPVEGGLEGNGEEGSIPTEPDLSGEAPPPITEPEGGELENASEEPEEEEDGSLELLTSSDDVEAEDRPIRLSIKDENAPVKVQRQLDRTLKNRKRRRTHGANSTGMPDFKRQFSHKTDDYKDPYDKKFFQYFVSNPLGESKEEIQRFEEMRYRNEATVTPMLSADIRKSLKKMDEYFGKSETKRVINEAIGADIDLEEDN